LFVFNIDQSIHQNIIEFRPPLNHTKVERDFFEVRIAHSYPPQFGEFSPSLNVEVNPVGYPEGTGKDEASTTTIMIFDEFDKFNNTTAIAIISPHRSPDPNGWYIIARAGSFAWIVCGSPLIHCSLSLILTTFADS